MQIEGRNVILETLRSPREITKIYMEAEINRDEKISEIIHLIQKRRLTINWLTKKKLASMSKTGNHQGVIAEAPFIFTSLSSLLDYNHDNGIETRLIYIREAQLEDNIGAIARSAEAAGFQGIVLPPRQGLTPQILRSSTGAISHLELVHEGLFPAIAICKKNGIKVVGIELKTKNKYYETDLTGEVMLIVGGEDRSLSDEVIEKCDVVVKIPQYGNVNSLNMSVAAAIVIFESSRQLGISKSPINPV